MPTYADVGGPFADKLPVAPVMAVRNPLGRAEAQVAQLTNDLADLRREFDRAVSRLKTATSDNWRLKRRKPATLSCWRHSRSSV